MATLLLRGGEGRGEERKGRERGGEGKGGKGRGGEALAVEPSHFSTGSDATGLARSAMWMSPRRVTSEQTLRNGESIIIYSVHSLQRHNN